METRKSLVFSAGVVAIAALFATTNVIAQSPTPPTQCTTPQFSVNVQTQNTSGVSSYVYTIASLTGANANKFFVPTKGRQVDGQGLQNDLVGTISGNLSGVYVNNGSQGAADCPPLSFWTDNKTDDGWCFTAISTANQPTLTVSERFKPQEGTTTVGISCAGGKQQCPGGNVQFCGPIVGPTGPGAPGFGGQFAAAQNQICFKNGCCYFATQDPTTSQVTNLVPDPTTPFETQQCGGVGQPPCQACAVDQNASCNADLSIPDCGRVLITAPIQTVPGGTCYYPPNIKFTC